MMTQTERILYHMEHIGPITCKQAAEDYGIMALHSRIADLRRDGYVIAKKHETGRNRFGEPCHWYAYSIVEAES